MRYLPAIALLLLLPSGCIEFTEISGAPGREQVRAVITLGSGNSGPVDTLEVRGSVYVESTEGARRFRFADDTLRVAGRDIARTGQGYTATLLLPRETLLAPVRVRLPVVEATPLPLRELDVAIPSMRGADSLTVLAGSELVLPLSAGRGSGLGATGERWSVVLRRGLQTAQVEAMSPLPEPLVLPASLIPQDTASTVVVELRANRSYLFGELNDPALVYLFTAARMRWRVRVAPAR